MQTKSNIADKQFAKAFKALPLCIDVDPLADKTLADLKFRCLIQLDLIEEGQDGTVNDDPAAIRKWLKKYGVNVSR